MRRAALLIALVVALPARAADPAADAELAAEAARAVQAGREALATPGAAQQHFRAAAALYETLRRRGYHNPGLYRNQGNSMLLGGDLPGAILAYHRGLRQSPNDPDLREHLAYARSQVVYPAPGTFGRPASEAWPPWLPRPDLRLRLLAAGLTYALTWVVLTRWLMTRRTLYRTTAGGSAVVAVLLFAWWGYDVNREHEAAAHPLVVVAKDGVALRQGNGPSYPTRYDPPLHRGTEARLLFDRGDWLQVQLAGGEVGWLPRRDVLVDGP